MRISLVQHDICWEEPEATFERLAPMIAAAAGSGGRLVLLTEMYAAGFTMAVDRVVESEDGPSTRFLVDQAAKHDVWLGGSVPVRSPARAQPVNQFVVAGPDGTLHRYAKIHPFAYAGEHERYGSGDATITFEIEGVRVTPFVCYDLRFANVFWGTALGTDLYVVVANWPASRRAHWQALLTARAIENQAYVAGVNRVGQGGKLAYAGDSRIIDPLGEVLASAAEIETVLTADIDPARVAAVREEFPFLADRRIL